MFEREEKTAPVISFAYRLFYTFLITSGIYLCVMERLHFEGNLFLEIAVIGVCLAILTAADCGRGKAAFLFAAVILGGVAGSTFLGGEKASKEIEGVWEKLLASPVLPELGSLALLAIAVYLVWLLAERFYKFRLVLSGAVFLGLLAVMFARRRIPHLGVAAVLFYLVSTVVELIQKRWEKRRQSGDEAYFLWVLPFLALYFLLLAVVPYRDTPYDWHFVRVWYQRAQKQFTKVTENLFFGRNEDFVLSTSGFSDHSGFFGNLSKRKGEMLFLKGWPSYGGGVYLTGKVYDTFDGRTWTLKGDGGREDLNLDLLETLYAVRRTPTGQGADYVREDDLEVEYRYFHTKYLFAPVKTMQIEGLKEDKEYRAAGGEVRFAKRRGYGTVYQVHYLQMNLHHPDFIAVFESAALPDSEEIWNRVLQEQKQTDYRFEDLLEVRERRREQYLTKPVLSEQVREWLGQVTGECGTDYERMKELERALSEFSYQMRPGELPPEIRSEEAFLDYFLIESREGYCSYFATAFVLLARAEGMPARYVQGFCIPGEATYGWAKKETIVTSNMAHAWPEVYFEGIGWIPFEPTPGFKQYRSAVWKTSGDREREKEQQIASSQGNTWREEEERPAPPPDIAQEEEEAKEEKLSVREWLLLAGAVLGGFAASLALFLAADALWERIRRKKRSEEESFRLEFLRNLQILRMLDYRREETETLADLQNKVDAETKGLGGFIPIYEEVLYGGRKADAQMTQKMCEYGNLLRERLRDLQGSAYLFSRIWLYLTRVRG